MTYNLTNPKSGLIEKSSGLSKTYSTTDRYTQFGDYITSLTPSVFVIKFLDIRLCSTWENQMNNLAIIDNNNFAWSSAERIANFSQNSTVNINLNGNIAQDVNMIYLVSIPMFYYQEFELPEQYSNFTIDMAGSNNLTYLNFGGSNNIDYSTASSGIGGIKVGRIIKGSNNPLMAPIFDQNWTGFNGNFPEMPHTTVFGNTDSTFIFSSKGGASKDDPLGTGGDIIRSNKFNSITLHAIPNGETKTLVGIMNFNTSNLIQIYAGKDNIPFTSDDIFVYAPKYWERLSVNLASY
ncbi:MAG: hypothetical protein Q8907_13155 [Bacteroidota bacterium]|nr:hypothetical protein [Bacteroidota bacterium]MDP4226796.1 hypothetical protein [Bacteroidota bacterium]MDP4275218.1 hypothetical protein [Bacteroidota bacterium]